MQTEKMTLKDFEALGIKKCSRLNRGYARTFRSFMEGTDEVLTFTFENSKDVRSCNGTIRAILKKENIKCKTIVAGLKLYVIKED